MFSKHLQATDIPTAKKAALYGRVVIWGSSVKPFLRLLVKSELQGNRIRYLKILLRAVSHGLQGYFDNDLPTLNRIINGRNKHVLRTAQQGTLAFEGER